MFPRLQLLTLLRWHEWNAQLGFPCAVSLQVESVTHRAANKVGETEQVCGGNRVYGHPALEIIRLEQLTACPRLVCFSKEQRVQIIETYHLPWTSFQPILSTSSCNKSSTIAASKEVKWMELCCSSFLCSLAKQNY